MNPIWQHNRRRDKINTDCRRADAKVAIAIMALMLGLQTSQAKEPSPVATKDTADGEYLGTDAEGKRYGAQAVLRSSEYDTHYDVLMFQGGLPGDGWKEGMPKFYMKMQDEYNQKLGLYRVDNFKTAVIYYGKYEKGKEDLAQLKFESGYQFIPGGLELKRVVRTIGMRVSRPNRLALSEPSWASMPTSIPPAATSISTFTICKATTSAPVTT